MDWTRWSEYYAPQSYELNLEIEYHAIRTAAGLIDISPLFKILISGPDSLALLNQIVTRNLLGLKEYRLAYVLWCDPNGFVLGDGTIMRQGPDTYFLTCKEPTYEWITTHGEHMNVRITDKTKTIAGLSLQGPASAKILSRAGIDTISNLKYFGATSTNMSGSEIWLSRSGFTGDLGYEIWSSSDQSLNIWDTLMEAGSAFSIQAAGLKAMDICRIEAGLLCQGIDFHSASLMEACEQKSTPYDLGLGWLVHLDHGPFIGQTALQQIKRPRYTQVGLEIDWPQTKRLYESERLSSSLPAEAWPMSLPLYQDTTRQHQVGFAPSGSWSPLLKKYIALASIESSYTSEIVQIELPVGHSRHCVDAKIVAPRFYDPLHKRAPVE